MNRVVTEACKALGADSAAISLREEGRWSVAYAYGFPTAILGAEISDEENPHALLAIKTQQVIAVNDAFNDARVNREVMKKYDITSVMVIPLVIKSEAVGAFSSNRHKTPLLLPEARLILQKSSEVPWLYPCKMQRF